MLLATMLLVAAAGVVGNDVWWESAVVYQVYPRSFKDSSGDGIGDLNGIREKLTFLKETGIDVIWLSPIFESPMYDFGYDITDYRKISSEYGTMDDFDNLMFEAEKLGVRVILDYVPNHTSNESEWFLKSVRREPQYEDFYVWADGKPDPEHPGRLLPPSNWLSVFRKSSWTYNEDRQQYYLHQFAVEQPDLNFRNAMVREEMNDVLRFWLDKGVSGFRMDAILFLYEADPKDYNGQYPDEPLSGAPGTGPEDHNHLNHIYTMSMNESYEVVYNWRALLDEYTRKHGESKLMMTEAYGDISLLMRYYGNGEKPGSIPFNFEYLEGVTQQSTARDMKQVIDKWMTYMPKGKTANWVNGNHDKNRLASRLGADRVDAMNMLALILPGITITYQGEELGMTNGYVSWQDTIDPQACNTDDPVNYWKKSRDPVRTPYHWDDSKNAGFSTAKKTWLPVADNYRELNLAAQMRQHKSHYKFYKDVVAVKKSPAVKYGDLDTRAISEALLVIIRLLPGHPAVVGIINLSDKEEIVDLKAVHTLPQLSRVVASGVNCKLEKGDMISKDNVAVSGHCALVLETTENCC